MLFEPAEIKEQKARILVIGVGGGVTVWVLLYDGDAVSHSVGGFVTVEGMESVADSVAVVVPVSGIVLVFENVDVLVGRTVGVVVMGCDGVNVIDGV